MSLQITRLASNALQLTRFGLELYGSLRVLETPATFPAKCPCSMSAMARFTLAMRSSPSAD